MYVIAWLTIVNPERNQETRPDHLAYIDRLWRMGKIWAGGPLDDGSGGVVVYQNVSSEEGMALAMEDPAVTSGARTVKTWVWNPLHFPLSHS